MFAVSLEVAGMLALLKCDELFRKHGMISYDLQFEE
jgi:hypothetical protein